MKKILLALLLLVGTKAFAQDQDAPLKQFPVKDGKVVYEEVVEAPGVKKEQIYQSAKKWFVDAFRSAKDVLQSEDKDAGQLIGKGLMDVDKKGPLGSTVIYHVNFYIQIDCKDGKYRYRIYNITHTLDGKTESDAYAKYFVNVPAENDNDITSGAAKGYSKGQRKSFANLIEMIDQNITALTEKLKASIKAGKSDDF